MKTVRLTGAIAMLLAAALLTAGVMPVAAHAATPDGIARRILGHAPTGLAALVVHRGYVRVAVDANYPPQSSIDPSSEKPVGFDVDVSSRVAEILGLDIRFKYPAWETITAGLTDHRYYDVSIGSMDITRARRLLVDFTTPYRYTGAQVVVKKGGPQIDGARSLYGRRVGVEADSVYHQFLKGHPEIVAKTYATATDALLALRAGRLRFVLMGQEDARYAIKTGGMPLRFSGHPLFQARLAAAVGKGQADWLALVDHAIRKMRRDGSLSELSYKWYGRDLTVWRW